MSLTLSGSSVLWRVKLGDALEIRNGIIFDFYSGLPHVAFQLAHIKSVKEASRRIFLGSVSILGYKTSYWVFN